MRKKTEEAQVVFLVLALTLSISAGIYPTNASSSVVRVEPALLEYDSNAIGEEFTVTIRIVNVANFYGFDIRLRWNITCLEYVSHSLRVPKNTYADGVLWNPLLEVKDEVNAADGTYWIAYSSMYPAPSFNGTGTAFTMTFRVIYQPQEPEPTAQITLELYSTQLVNKAAVPIAHSVENGTVILHPIAMRTRMYIDPKKKTSDVSGVYQSRPTSYTTTGTAQPYYFHGETVIIGGETYYLLIPTSADATGLNFIASMGSVGRILWARTVYALRGAASISGAAWTVYYRTWFDASPVGGAAHADVNILIRKSDGTIRTTTASNVADSTGLSSTATTRSGTCSFSSYTVVDQTDYLEIDYYLEVTTAASKNAYLRIEDTTLPTTAQTRVASPTMIPFVTNPTNAYDGNEDTYASFLTNADGTIDFKYFDTTFPETDIAEVDLRIKYQALKVAGGNDRFKISQTVSPSTTYSTLQDWTASDTEVPLGTHEWLYRTEPNDGIWSWIDLSNIVTRFQNDVVGTGENREVRIFEVWATVFDKPFSVNIRAELVEDLYSWSTKVVWDPTIIELTNLSKGPFLTGPEGTIFTSTINRTGGYVDLSEQIVGQEYQGVSGAGILAELTFKVLKEGKSSISLLETEFLNSALEIIEHVAENGSFNTPTYHDIAITDLIVGKTTVYQGEIHIISVIIRNKGTYTESFNVYLYANSTGWYSETITDLAGEAEIILSPGWNTAEVPRGNYTIQATTSDVEGDYDKTSNTISYSAIRVRFGGDINDDGKVTVTDLFMLGKAFGSWNPDADLNGDDIVDSLDLSALNSNYGKTG